jgi:hypothetical protein
VDGENGIKKMSEPDAVRLGDKAEERAVAIEAPGSTDLEDLKAGLVVAVEDLIGHFPGRPAVDQSQGIGTVPLDAHNHDRRVGQNAADGRVGLELF